MKKDTARDNIMAFVAPDEHARLRVELERRRADKVDMVRRIRERDIRSTQFANKTVRLLVASKKALAADHKKALKAEDERDAEQSKRYELQLQLADANEGIDEQQEQIDSLVGRLELSASAHSMALEQLTELQKELAVSRAEAARLESTCETLRSEREAAKQEALELRKLLAISYAKAGKAKQAAVSMMEQMGRERGELKESLSMQRDLAQKELDATKVRLELERVQRARQEEQFEARAAADRAEWQAMRQTTLNEYESRLKQIQEQLWEAQAQNVRLGGERAQEPREAVVAPRKVAGSTDNLDDGRQQEVEAPIGSPTLGGYDDNTALRVLQDSSSESPSPRLPSNSRGGDDGNVDDAWDNGGDSPRTTAVPSGEGKTEPEANAMRVSTSSNISPSLGVPSNSGGGSNGSVYNDGGTPQAMAVLPSRDGMTELAMRVAEALHSPPRSAPRHFHLHFE